MWVTHLRGQNWEFLNIHQKKERVIINTVIKQLTIGSNGKIHLFHTVKDLMHRFVQSPITI